MEKRVYLSGFGCWDEPDKERWQSHSVLGQFQEQNIPEPELVWADYDNGGYEGSALVVFKQDEKWYSVRGSHCSCYGLEGQWSPEEFDPKLHFKALKEGKRIVEQWSTDSKSMDKWLKEMTKE